MRSKWLLFALLFAPAAFAQNGLVPVPPIFLGPANGPRLGAGLTITFCTSTATGVPCSPLAQAYADSTNGSPINQGINPLKTDALGNAPVFYAAPGQYSYTITGPSIGTPQGPYQITVSCIPGTTCVALGANNAFTGNNTHSGTETFTGLIQCANFETTRCVDINNSAGWAGADVCAWTLSAYGNLPATGGKIMVGDGVYPACAGGLAIAVSGAKYVDIYFGNVSLTLSNTFSLSGGGGNSHLIGIPDISIINQSATFPNATPTILLGGSGETNLTATGMTVKCNASVTNSIGFKIQTQDLSGLNFPIAQNCTQYGIWFEGFGLSFCEHCWALTKGATANGFYIHNVVGFKGTYLHSVANAGVGDPVASHIIIDGGSAVINNVHCEDGTNCIDVGPVAASIVETHGVSGGTGITTVLKVENTSSNRLNSYATLSNGATNVVVDSLNSITRTDSFMPRYQNFGPTGNQIWMEDGTVGRVFYHAAANQNIRLESQGGTTTIEAVNDALNADVPLSLASFQLQPNSNMVSTGIIGAFSGTGACATVTTTAGGAFAGTGKCTGATAASTLTITFSPAAPNGWTCDVWDETTRANVFQQTSHTTASCTLTVTSVTQNDVFVFKAIGF